MESIEAEDESSSFTKDWLQQTNQSLTRLKGVKKSAYQLGGGPREKEVNCQCNYRSKHSSSFLSLDADPPELPLNSQETASNSELSIPELLKHYHERKSQLSRTKRRPYSAIVCSTKDAQKVKEKKEVKKENNLNAFITVKGETVNPQPRPPITGPVRLDDDKLYKGACMLHLDPQHIEEVQKATIEGLRKYSAYGQGNESSSPPPPPPRASPEPIFTFPDEEKPAQDTDDESCIDDDYSDDESELQSIGASDGTKNTASMTRPLVFEIPTADLEYCSGDEDTLRGPNASPSAEQARGLSADYVAKSDVFLDELALKSAQETEELSAMFSDMEIAKNRVENIDLRSVLSSAMTAGRRTVSPSGVAELPQGDPTGLSVVNIGMPLEELEPCAEGRNYDALWVEEPYVPRIRSAGVRRDVHSGRERFHRPQRRVQSAKTRKQEYENELVLEGKTFEFLNSQDLAVSGRLSGHPSRRSCEAGPRATKSSHAKDRARYPAQEKIVGKPPRPKSGNRKKKHKEHKQESAVGANSKSPGLEDTVTSIEETTNLPHPPHSRKSSLRKAFSQGDVRCLSPEVISSVKKTVSFSEEVFEKHTRPLVKSNKDSDPSSGNPESSEPITDAEKHSVSETTHEEKEKKCHTAVPNVGVIIQNGLEVREPVNEVQQSPSDSGPSASKVRTKNECSTKSRLIAKVKEAVRCSCHDEECHCRDITRPTMAVLYQAKAAREQAADNAGKDGRLSPPAAVLKEKLLKQRPSRPSSAPIRRAPERPRSPTSPTRSTVDSASSQHKRSGPQGSRRPRPVSAHIKRPR